MLSLSAFKDPLTGEPLNIPPEAKAALNDPALKASSSEQAYVPGAGNLVTDHANFAGGAWAERHGMEHIETAQQDLLPAPAKEP